MLGRGAFGLAVAAVNRLDGRQYAVKKIRLQQKAPGEFARIMREVATLARLQHTNIVRYFQVSTSATRDASVEHSLPAIVLFYNPYFLHRGCMSREASSNPSHMLKNAESSADDAATNHCARAQEGLKHAVRGTPL